MSPGPTFERVYEALKDQLRVGRHAPGAHLEPALLSEELNASITPVRDALHRLAGERLVETPRGEGFRFPMISEQKLRQLYSWNEQLLLLALRMAIGRKDDARQLGHVQASGNLAHSGARIAELFAAIAASAGNIEHATAIAALNDRLAFVRCREPMILSELGPETDALTQAFRDGQWPELRRQITSYHRRRLRIVEQIVGILLASP